MDEAVPSPTRKVSAQLTVTYAGFEGERELLESLHKRGLQGDQIAPTVCRQPGMLMFWSHDPELERTQRWGRRPQTSEGGIDTDLGWSQT